MATGRDLIEYFEIDTEVLQDAYIHRLPVESLDGPERAVRTEVWIKGQKIGSGGFGTVWKVHDSHSERVRAVKEIDKHPRGYKIDHYLHELLAMACCSKELSSFVKFEGWFQTASQIFITMEYFEHGDLESCIDDPIPESEAQLIVAQVAVALSFMHRKSFSHRDVNSKNILVKRPGPRWWVKLGDFGIAKRVRGSGATSPLKTQFAGTHIAPEQDPSDDEDQFGEDTLEYDYAVDIWSLGHVVHWLLTLSSPFAMNTQRETRLQFKRYRRGKIPFPTEKLESANASADAVSFVQGCMFVSPGERMTVNSALQHPWLVEATKGLIFFGEIERERPIHQIRHPVSTQLGGYAPPSSEATRHGIRSIDELLERNNDYLDQKQDVKDIPATALQTVSTGKSRGHVASNSLPPSLNEYTHSGMKTPLLNVRNQALKDSRLKSFSSDSDAQAWNTDRLLSNYQSYYFSRTSDPAVSSNRDEYTGSAYLLPRYYPNHLPPILEHAGASRPIPPVIVEPSQGNYELPVQTTVSNSRPLSVQSSLNPSVATKIHAPIPNNQSLSAPSSRNLSPSSKPRVSSSKFQESPDGSLQTFEVNAKNRPSMPTNDVEPSELDNTQQQGTNNPADEPSSQNDESPNLKHAVLKAFKSFAAEEKEKIREMNKERDRKARELRLDDLRKFADNFKLNSPVPDDIQEIFAGKSKNLEDDVPSTAQEQLDEKWVPSSCSVIIEEWSVEDEVSKQVTNEESLDRSAPSRPRRSRKRRQKPRTSDDDSAQALAS